MNKVELIGRLTHDVEMRQTPNGVSLARFSIAVTRRFKNSNGEYDADFINCVAWRQTGEFIAKHLFERNQYYEKAKYTISISNQSTLEILDQIMNHLKTEKIWS